ncbi:MAG: solute carrier family 26 protein [Balneolaceae bacterium]|nr:solute carrier family 26 protein [Balneolaceae bacterium]
MNNNRKSPIRRFIPITDWLRDYGMPALRGDLRAGITVGILLIPQSMAYALLAGMPPVYGFYASIVPLVIYAVFGTSRQLAVGPVAIVSIMVAAGAANLASAGTEIYITLVLAISFLVGVTQFLMGLFRMGFLMNFLSKPVLSGFTSAAAFIIGFSQLGDLMGVEVARSKYAYVMLTEALSRMGQFHGPTLAVGLGSILVIVALRRWAPRLPAQLLAVVGAILVAWMMRLDRYGVEIVGSVQAGYPVPSLPALAGLPWWQVMPTVLAVAFLGFTSSIALAKAIERRRRSYKVDSNQELFAMGLANMAGSLFHAYPVAGSFSRTAVNDENGARTGMALVISAAMVALALLLLIPLIHYLPYAALAAIIITAVPGLVEVGEARFLWRVRRREFRLMLLTFVATMALGILEGIGVGVLISLGIVIYQSSYPNIVMLGRIPDSDTYRDLERYPQGLTQTNTIIVRIDSSLYFANVSYLKEKLEQLEYESGKQLRQVIIDAVGINDVDASALHALKDVIDDYRERDIKVIFTGVKGPVRDMFSRSGLDDVVGPEQFYLDISKAVESLDRESEEVSHLA